MNIFHAEISAAFLLQERVTKLRSYSCLLPPPKEGGNVFTCVRLSVCLACLSVSLLDYSRKLGADFDDNFGDAFEGLCSRAVLVVTVVSFIIKRHSHLPITMTNYVCCCTIVAVFHNWIPGSRCR